MMRLILARHPIGSLARDIKSCETVLSEVTKIPKYL
jgi:hypothetical protein